jgi:hypothetical protein
MGKLPREGLLIARIHCSNRNGFAMLFAAADLSIAMNASAVEDGGPPAKNGTSPVK